MDRSTVITLVGVTYTTDSIGQRKAIESDRAVFGNVQSVTRGEWVDAGNRGFKPEWRVTMFAPDYAGEGIVKIESTRYSVYRTFIRQDENIELYLERRPGS